MISTVEKIQHKPISQKYLVLIVVLLFGMIIFSLPKVSSAQSLSFTQDPFGGRSLYTKYCTCTLGCFLMYIGPPKGGWHMWCPWTQFYMYYNIFPSAWQLGLGGMEAPCLMYYGEDCGEEGSGKLMIMDGTSLY